MPMPQNAPDRATFAMQNHASAVRHFRQEAARLERIAAMHRLKADEHVAAARARVDSDAFDAWLRALGEKS
ncbi:MAG: hypothetical protein AB7S55_06355 [Thiomonas sp.]